MSIPRHIHNYAVVNPWERLLPDAVKNIGSKLFITNCMSLTTTLAHKRIEEYHRLRDTVGLSRHAELSHTIAMRAMDLLRRVRFGIGEKWMEMLRDWCHFPHLKNEMSVWNFSLGGINIQYPVGIAAGMFKDVSRVPWELFGERRYAGWFHNNRMNHAFCSARKPKNDIFLFQIKHDLVAMASIVMGSIMLA